MSDTPELSKTEHIKSGSRFLRGTLREELKNDSPEFSDDATQLLKFHGSYQQDNRDLRRAKNPDGTPKGRHFIMMIRTRLPGGRCSAAQLLAELELADTFGNGTLRLTSRQGFQLHHVLKKNIRETIAAINEAKLSTIAACGDVSRNVMSCPAPIRGDGVRDEMYAMAAKFAEHFKPKSEAYYEVWLRDLDEPESPQVNVTDPQAAFEVEPIYGLVYLPRKFKFGFGLPDDNCVDCYGNDLGFITVHENGKVIGYNALPGGSMGQTPSRKDTFPAVGKRMAFVEPGQMIDFATAVVGVQRDNGNRSDRKRARMKYLLADWGVPKFKAKVEEYLGYTLPDPHPTEVHDVDDHLGWREQGDGNLFLGLAVPDGRIEDVEGGAQWKTAIREILAKHAMECRVTAICGLLLCDIPPEAKPEINAVLRKHKIPLAEELSLLRRYSMACVALPTCGLAVTESERVIHDVIHAVEARVAKYGLSKERIAIHMTGCPNGCSRPYTPDIGIVGKTLGKYTLYLGGNILGTRIGFIYADTVPLDKLADVVSPALAYYKQARKDGEGFGDFCHRVGKEDLQRYAKLLEQETAILDGELGALSDAELTALLERFADDLSCEQLQKAMTEGTHRLTNGSAGNEELTQAVTAAGKRLDVFAGSGS
ncbi:MAG: NADPH-dependent assimilatory sulfite reductase hemoprotein subunit [Planctomycetaceae bacterium]